MLHVDRAWHRAATWAHHGFAPIDGGAPVHGQLYFALTELAAAADAADLEVCDDLILEVGVLADLLVRTEPVRGDPSATSVVVELWGELQRAAGSKEFEVLAAQAVLLRRLLPTPARARGPHDVPRYLITADRFGGGRHLALVASAEQLPPADPAAAFLHGLAVALLAGHGHLVDADTGECPQEGALLAVGWATANRPKGPTIGAIDSVDQVLILDPHRTVQAVRSTGHPDITATAVAHLLVDRWLMDSTLVVDEHQVLREPAVLRTDTAGAPTDSTWAWRIPTMVWAPTQFTDRPPRTRTLRAIPNDPA